MIRLFTFRLPFFYLLLLVTFVQSCSIQKRRYRDGFYIERHSLIREHNRTVSAKNADSLDDASPVKPTSHTENTSETASPETPANSTTYNQVSIRESAHVPDTFIVEEEQGNELSPKQRIKHLLKYNKDPEGLPIVPPLETANTFMIIGLATLVLSGIGPFFAFISLILLWVAYARLRNAPEGTYSPDNYLLVRRTFWISFACMMLPVLLFGIILLLIFL
ncbi:MAG: hypothetical protein IM638_09000 [Bacteroidetes bacterium]|nr:hypothetical protein [Bacteroidota bacterium]